MQWRKLRLVKLVKPHKEASVMVSWSHPDRFRVFRFTNLHKASSPMLSQLEPFMFRLVKDVNSDREELLKKQPQLPRLRWVRLLRQAVSTCRAFFGFTLRCFRVREDTFG